MDLFQTNERVKKSVLTQCSAGLSHSLRDGFHLQEQHVIRAAALGIHSRHGEWAAPPELGNCQWAGSSPNFSKGIGCWEFICSIIVNVWAVGLNSLTIGAVTSTASMPEP